MVTEPLWLAVAGWVALLVLVACVASLVTVLRMVARAPADEADGEQQ